jgi:hypothetical protein
MSDLESKFDEIRARIDEGPEDATNSTPRPDELEKLVTDEPKPDPFRIQPIDLDLEEEDEVPTLLRVKGAAPLLYEGKVNALYGETESGKSYLTLHAAAELLREDPTAYVLWLDYEDTVRTFRRRCRSLGLTKDLTDRIHYVNPAGAVTNRKDPSLSSSNLAYLEDKLRGTNYRLAVIDTMNRAMAIEGADPNAAGDYALVDRWLMKRIVEVTGAAVVVLDHVTKSREGRGKYAYGAVDKLNSISGAAYTIEVVKPWSQAKGPDPIYGQAHVKITKDRPGGRRGGLSDLSVIAVVDVAVYPDRTLDFSLVPQADSVFVPPMDIVRAVLDEVRVSGPLTPNAIYEALKGNRKVLLDTVKWLRELEVLRVAGTKGTGVLLEVDELQVREHDLD